MSKFYKFWVNRLCLYVLATYGKKFLNGYDLTFNYQNENHIAWLMMIEFVAYVVTDQNWMNALRVSEEYEKVFDKFLQFG